VSSHFVLERFIVVAKLSTVTKPVSTYVVTIASIHVFCLEHL